MTTIFDASFFKDHSQQIIATVLVIIAFLVVRLIANSLIYKFGKKSDFSQARINLVIKYMNMFITLFACVLLITVWGVEGEQALLVISSIFTVIGVAMFAQWSILSNITAGIILFFSFPFKIGNRIQIMDKEYPIEAEIVDIKSFYTLLKTKDEELICYPNNLLLQKGIVIMGNANLSTD
ncbi:mechanosensitive ion channel domain-containing protein [Capnocytophaga canimorsus]|uniref:mechanosensitive ion channel domain-containing protein n=1 Tax=Capnocytophaga canimorsus TaxID=28188 RepID=UPI0037D4ED69